MRRHREEDMRRHREEDMRRHREEDMRRHREEDMRRHREEDMRRHREEDMRRHREEDMRRRREEDMRDAEKTTYSSRSEDLSDYLSQETQIRKDIEGMLIQESLEGNFSVTNMMVGMSDKTAKLADLKNAF